MEQQVILVVDDDNEIVFSICKLLEFDGFKTLSANDGIEALEVLEKNPVDLVLLDVMMPKMDGIASLMRIRESSHIPVIILSAKTQDSDKVYGLISGADDYIGKPYNPEELSARVKALLRRYRAWGTREQKSSTNIIKNDGLILNMDSKTITVDGLEKKLTAKEYKVLELFMKNMGRVFSAEEIYEQVWEESSDYAVENTVMVHIRRIREKVEINPKKPKYIKVVWGIGYKMEHYEEKKVKQ